MRGWIVWVAVVFWGSSFGWGDALALSAGPPDEATVALMNQGVALMEQHRFGEAVEVFQKVVERAPRWAIAHLNLGIALLNAGADASEEGGPLDQAAAAFQRAAQLDPELPHPHYCLGLLARYRGDSETAIRHFQEVLRRDPRSADALYFLGTIYLQRGDPKRARTYFERALEENPYLLSAHYSLAQALIRLGERQAALERLQLFRRLDAAGVGVKRAIVYTEMGPYADVVRIFPPAPDAPKPEALQVDWEPVPWTIAGLQESGLRLSSTAAGPALADWDNDGDLDLALPLQGADGGGTIGWARNENGAFRLEATVPVDGLPRALLFGDWDNDGRVDLAVFGDGLLLLLRQEESGQFGAPQSLAAVPKAWTAAAWVDADHDSDLDLLVLGETAVQLWQNRGEEGFVEIASEAGLKKPYSALKDLAVADFDADGDVDFLLLSAVRRPYLFLNERLNRWREASQDAGFADAPGARRVLAADFDRDEDIDLFVLHQDGTLRFYANTGPARFAVQLWPERLSAATGVVLDADNDSDLDLLWLGPTRFFRNDGSGRFQDLAALDGQEQVPQAALPWDADNDGDRDLLLTFPDGTLQLLRTVGGEKNHWLRLALRGAMANRSGYGAQVEMKAGSLWQRVDHQMLVGPGGGTNPWVAFGLDGKSQADYVRIVWPNAVIQSEMLLPADRLVTLEEVQRKASSCPILFAWNGERFVFVTDFLGVGGVGFFVAPGEYGQPDPTERIKLEPDQIAPREGRLLFRIAEPFEEVGYLDEVALLAIDHPPGTAVYPDERFALNGQLPSERIYVVGEPVLPQRAVDDQGRDVLEAVLRRDRRYPPVRRHPRYLGYLANEAAWTFDFSGSDVKWDPSRRKILFVYGWIEYPYSHLVYGAYQEGIRGQGFHLDVPDGRGGWREAIRNAGYPAGMPKMMTLDVTEWFDPNRSVFRLRTNLEIYIDAVFLAEDLGEERLRVRRLEPESAELRYLGFPREYSPDGRLPRIYDYASVDRTVPFKIHRGRYTRFGDVRELLLTPDDRYVVFGRGEEIALAFRVETLPPPPAGWERSYVLHTDGFAKDMDLYTAAPNTVEPLPFHAMSAYPYPPTERYPNTPAIREYLRVYQTRWK